MKTFFVFSGQGAQAPGMGKDLYESSAAAKAIFDQADDILGYKLSEICFNGPAEKLTETNYCQVAIYTMSCAALEAFKEKHPEVKAVAAAGLSLGEYGALYAGGVFSFADGLKLLAKRNGYSNVRRFPKEETNVVRAIFCQGNFTKFNACNATKMLGFRSQARSI